MNIKISRLKKNSKTNAIVSVGWTASLEYNHETTLTYGEVKFNNRDPNDPDFISLESLTEDIVVDWIKESIGPEIEQKLNDQMQEQIEAGNKLEDSAEIVEISLANNKETE